VEIQKAKLNALKVQSHQLRSFGLSVGITFALIGLWPLVIYQEDIRYWAILVGSLLTLGALAQPVWLQPLFVGWMKVGHLLGFINTRLILGIGFFFLFTPIGLIRRIIGKDSLHRRLEPSKPSYRSPCNARLGKHMKNQY